MFARQIERLLYACRWIVAPFLLLLAVSLFALLIKALQHSWILATHLLASSELDVIVDVLGYIELTLGVFLIVIVMLAGYENLVSHFVIEEEGYWPIWLRRVDFAGLKLRLLSSIVAISAIQLLRVFLDVSVTSNRDLAWYVAIHLTFVLSGLLLALTDRLTRRDPANGPPP